MINPHKFCSKPQNAQCIPREEKVWLELPDCTCKRGIRRITCVKKTCPDGSCYMEPEIVLLMCDGSPAPEGTCVTSINPQYVVNCG